MSIKKLTSDALYFALLCMLKPVALLPLRVLYVFSDILCFVLHRVVRYRLKLVRANLKACFFEENAAGLPKIERRFYRNLSDYMVETVKLLHISDRQIQRRFIFENLDIIHGYLAQDKPVVAYFSHCGNWEWAPSFTLHFKAESAAGDLFCQIYRPLRNHAFDRLMLKVRSRFGSVSIPKTLTMRKMIEMRRNKTCWVTGFMSDQKPSHGDTDYILQFLGRPTKVITGTESLARRLGTAVVYWDMYRLSRGHFKIVVRDMCADASQTAQHQLTDRYFEMLQQTICRDPASWLWSHNRWSINRKTL